MLIVQLVCGRQRMEASDGKQARCDASAACVPGALMQRALPYHQTRTCLTQAPARVASCRHQQACLFAGSPGRFSGRFHEASLTCFFPFELCARLLEGGICALSQVSMQHSPDTSSPAVALCRTVFLPGCSGTSTTAVPPWWSDGTHR